MRISLDAWSLAALALVASAGAFFFAHKAIGLPSSLGWWTLLASAATHWGRDAYSPRSTAPDRSIPKTMFWLAVLVVALSVWRTLA
jgi:hypothetical protein